MRLLLSVMAAGYPGEVYDWLRVRATELDADDLSLAAERTRGSVLSPATGLRRARYVPGIASSGASCSRSSTSCCARRCRHRHFRMIRNRINGVVDRRRRQMLGLRR